MGKGRVALVIFVILAVVFFVAPVVSYTFTSASLFGLANYSATAQVSLSYDLFQCGYVSNPQVQGSFLGVSGSYQQASSGFYCGNGNGNSNTNTNVNHY